MEAGTDLNVVIMQLDDQQAFKAMVDGNEQRREICDYSKALRFREALNRQLYASQPEAAAALGVSKGTMSKLMKLIDIPSDSVEAFSSPSALSINLGAALIEAIQRGFRDEIKRDAPRIESGEIRVGDIPAIWTDDREENGSAASKKPLGATGARTRVPKLVIEDSSGRKLVVATQTNRGATVVFPTITGIDDALSDELRKLVKRRQRA